MLTKLGGANGRGRRLARVTMLYSLSYSGLFQLTQEAGRGGLGEAAGTIERGQSHLRPKRWAAKPAPAQGLRQGGTPDSAGTGGAQRGGPKRAPSVRGGPSPGRRQTGRAQPG